ncbi:IS701 family transposase [Streptomyces sp. NPDC056663]|uniref:IS701 family transposase n=1 Tax=Streptomyces sp. NPDC056663 TaxID=3345899 RepID=UPI0036B2A83B
MLLPRDRNKTLTCLAGTEPVVGAQHPSVQRLQFFLSESTWDHERVNARRVELLLADPATAPHAGGVLVIDDSGDRKDGKTTAHIGRQWLGRLGKTDNGIVTVTTCWADENLYYPLHAVPYSPAHHFPKGRSDPGFRTKLQIAAELARTANAAGVAFRAVAADCAYGDQDGFRRQLGAAGLPFVMALKPSHGTWAYGKDAYTPVDAARALTWTDPEHPGDWTAIERTFRDGHTETWWAADAHLGWWGPDGNVRLVVTTADPATLPAKATWYLATDLPRPGGLREADSPEPAADLAEVVRIYGIRHWIEQNYKQVKDELGWADFQVRSDTAIRRHQTLVTCAFSFCWDTWFTQLPDRELALVPAVPPAATLAGPAERGPRQTPPAPNGQLAQGNTRRPGLARPLDQPPTLLASLDECTPATRTPSPDQRRRRRPPT